MDIIETALNISSFEYQFIYHDKQIYSATDGAEFFHIDPGQTAPTLIVETDKGCFSIIFSGSRSRVDFKYIAKLLDVSKVQLAKKSRVFEITGFDPGNTPMVGLNLPVIFDKRLLQYTFIYGGSGLPNRTLKISPESLVKLNNVVAFIND